MGDNLRMTNPSQPGSRFEGMRYRLRFDPGIAEHLVKGLGLLLNADELWFLRLNTLAELEICAGAMSGGYIPASSIIRLYRTQDLPPYEIYGVVSNYAGDWWLVTSLDDVIAIEVDPAAEYTHHTGSFPLTRLLVCLDDPDAFARDLGVQIESPGACK